MAATATCAVLLLVAAPWLQGRAGGAVGLLYAAGALICHQQPERSFHVGGSQLPVCARCLGIYLGAALGLVVWAATRTPRTGWPRRTALGALLASGIPTGVTVASAWLGLGDPSNLWRALLAVPLGIAGGWVAGAAATDHLK